MKKTTTAKKSEAAKSTSTKSRALGMAKRIEAVRMVQREEGNFDCFGRAEAGYCDQGGCFFLFECLDISKKVWSELGRA
jgi:hypothetical protein